MIRNRIKKETDECDKIAPGEMLDEKEQEAILCELQRKDKQMNFIFKIALCFGSLLASFLHLQSLRGKDSLDFYLHLFAALTSGLVVLPLLFPAQLQHTFVMFLVASFLPPAIRWYEIREWLPSPCISLLCLLVQNEVKSVGASLSALDSKRYKLKSV